ncbi:MAG TPA: malto-oligosyltrehalose trehalohydrolase [Gammaproteobacteria bacterium]|nr:malto-oligosyltrehalose trehalohydrolase [Gammaproteobacteria bacterium]
MKRRHVMPFGAQLTDDGRVRFRLWAPAASQVELCLEGAAPELCLPMAAEQGGWWGIITEHAAVETLYRYRIDGKLRIPDPASRFQPDDVHGPSQVIDPERRQWSDGHWNGRPWEQTVLYELHVGTFSPEGTFAGVASRLDHLVDLGVTAIELMPAADFPGTRNWGYDGVLPFAPDSCYGSPDDLKSLVEAAHSRQLMVFMDVVYNHFGPEGNYLHTYAPGFFTDRHHTPWGDAIDFEDPDSSPVRWFFIHNALYWLEEYGLDGLRLDAVHAIMDDSRPDILMDIGDAVRRTVGRQRHVHLVLENDDNAAHYLQRDGAGNPRWYDAQWNDDIHHALHVLATGEDRGYYADYADQPIDHLGRCLTEGFAFQGEASPYRDGQSRGEPTDGLPMAAFVGFVQNHDQVGNRAFGERITALASPEAVRAVTALVLLAPSPPLLFMGQEWGSHKPFPFFCDFEPELAASVTDGRRREFAAFPEFQDPHALEKIPDPMAVETFRSAVLDWDHTTQPAARQWLAFHRRLLAVRSTEIVPRLPGMRAGGRYTAHGPRALTAQWPIADRELLALHANLGPDSAELPEAGPGRCLFRSHSSGKAGRVPGWSVSCYLINQSAQR